MQEDFLHYIWQYNQFDVLNLKTTLGETIYIKSIGQHNHDSGPDFFNSQLEINGQLWAGNVEIHVKSSDWYVHNHETDAVYKNVILHVVWEHDVEVLRANNSKIPTLEIKSFVNSNALKNYQSLFKTQLKWINCEKDFSSINDFTINNWLEKLYIERLQDKSAIIEMQLTLSKQNWEAVLFQLLAKNFGSKVNGEAFFQLAKNIDFSIVRKLSNSQIKLEALLFGQANLLEEAIEDAYYVQLKKEYAFLKQKFQLKPQHIQLQFFRLRPNNFPTIRLSQLASLYSKHQSVFTALINFKNSKELTNFFKIKVSEYWESHYTFGKTSKSSSKNITPAFIDLIIINTVIPLRFAYLKSLDKADNEALLNHISTIKAEKNTIVSKFNSLKKVGNNAMQTQALIQLKNNYCDKNKCLQCAIGHTILRQND